MFGEQNEDEDEGDDEEAEEFDANKGNAKFSLKIF